MIIDSRVGNNVTSPYMTLQGRAHRVLMKAEDARELSLGDLGRAPCARQEEEEPSAGGRPRETSLRGHRAGAGAVTGTKSGLHTGTTTSWATASPAESVTGHGEVFRNATDTSPS